MVTLDSNSDLASRCDLLATDETKVQFLHQPSTQVAAPKTEVWTFLAIAPRKVTPYFGYIRIGSLNTNPIRSHSVLVTVNP